MTKKRKSSWKRKEHRKEITFKKEGKERIRR